MKLHLASRRFLRANTYFTVLVIAAVTGIILASYLTMVGTQNAVSMRSQAWNRSIAISEAGIEEALSHLKENGVMTPNLLVDGWWNLNGYYYKRAYVDDGLYEVQITQDRYSPTITSTGYVPLQQNYSLRKGLGPFLAGIFWGGGNTSNYLYRTVRVTTGCDGSFTKGIVVLNYLDLKGNGVRIDSYDSSDPAHSTNGMYYQPWCNDRGDVSTKSGITNYNNVAAQNANIFGHISTGPGGRFDIGPNGAIGSLEWQAAGNHGLQPGWFRDDFNMDFPPVGTPFAGGFTPSSGTVSNVYYTIALGTGNYVSTSSKKYTGQDKIIITGKAKWWCKAGIDFAGQGEITILPGAGLELYIGNTNGSSVSCSISGNGLINNTGYATNCMIFGLPTCTSISWSGNATFVGCVYAPNAAMTLGGGGSNPYDFCGSSTSRSISMNGHFNYHYDEYLGKAGWMRGYIVTSWNEVILDGH